MCQGQVEHQDYQDLQGLLDQQAHRDQLGFREPLVLKVLQDQQDHKVLKD